MVHVRPVVSRPSVRRKFRFRFAKIFPCSDIQDGRCSSNVKFLQTTPPAELFVELNQIWVGGIGGNMEIKIY